MRDEEFKIDIQEDEKKHPILYLILMLIVIFCIVLLYSRYISTSIIKVDEYPIYSETIDNELDGLKIVHFSDLLYGSTMSDNSLKKVVNKINKINPDIVVFTGDLISNEYNLDAKTIENITKQLNSIKAKYGKFAIRGDNDYKNDTYIEIMQNSNFKYLDNNYDLVYLTKDKYLFIGGINSSNESKIDYTNLKSFNEDNIYKIMLMHEPENIDDTLNNLNSDIVFAGHTLLGQFRVPFIGGISYDDNTKKYLENYYELNNTKLYISAGLGTLNYPFRFFNNPSINLYRIIKKEKQRI